MTDSLRKLLFALGEIVHSQTVSMVAIVVGNSCAYGSTRLIIERKFVHQLNREDVRTYERRPTV